jgi:predicted RNase H-like nuclease (RuvC/YqgF family)
MPPQLDQRVEIELLKKDISILSSLFEKFDSTLDKMQEIASNLSRMVSLQEQRLESQEKETEELQSVLEMRRVEHNNDIKELHSRITTVNRDLSDKIEETEKTILSELQAIRKEIKESHANKDDGSLSKRLAAIETWKYMMMGGIIVITWVLAKSDVGKIFKLIF